jgi:hypothetical protein
VIPVEVQAGGLILRAGVVGAAIALTCFGRSGGLILLRTFAGGFRLAAMLSSPFDRFAGAVGASGPAPTPGGNTAGDGAGLRAF